MADKRRKHKKIKLQDIYRLGKKIPSPPSDLPEPNLSENSWYVGETRYALRDGNGQPKETSKEMFWRIAYNIATAQRLYGGSYKDHLAKAKEIYTLIASQKFIANTPTMLNAGKPKQQLSACFVLPIEDDMESILKTMSDMALIHKSGGGTGFSFSRLRPYGDVISTSGGTTVGPISFMQAYNDVTTQIKQGGVRRGANMGILHITHPDILRFAVHKVDEFSLTNFNISVTVTEEFMEQVKKDEKYAEGAFNFEEVVSEIKQAQATRDVDLKLVRVEQGVAKLYDWCRATHDDEGYALINHRTKEEVDRLNAKKVFDLITRLAWEYGDPGLIYIDRINNSRANPTPNLGQIEATNPCAEQPLLPYDACTLGSINLAKFVKTEGKSWHEQIDWNSLKAAIHLAINFLDNVLDMNEYPISEIFEMTRKIRRVGLGVMGFADLLVQLGVGYNTSQGLEVGEVVMKFVQSEADKASSQLAKTRGVFPAYKGSIYDKPGEIKPRNAARTTIAPTGTISMLAGCSSGIEPHFAITFAKNTIEGKRLFDTNYYFLKVAKERGFYSEELLEKIEKNQGSIQGIDDVPEDVQKVFVVTRDISPEWHVRMLAAFQKYTDNGVSKTINFPNNATVEDVRNAYWKTFETKCNMITIYRDGSREKQVLEVKKDQSYYDQLAGGTPPEAMQTARTVNGPLEEVPVFKKAPTPTEAWGMRMRKRADVGHVYTSVFRNESGQPVEVFVTIGKTGGYVAGAAEATGRLASRALKYGASLEEVASDLIGITCGTPYGVGPNAILSAFDAVGKSILEISKSKQLPLAIEANGQAVEEKEIDQTSTNGQTQAVSNGQINGQMSDSNQDYQPNGQSEPSSDTTDDQQQLDFASVATSEKALFGICPDCGSPLIVTEGCVGGNCINPACGWSKCS